MAGHEGVSYQLLDADQRQIGKLIIERNEDKLLFGRFTPGPAYAEVQHLFREFEEAVHCQALPKIDKLDEAIDTLGLHLQSADGSRELAIKDVQIWSDGGITCRLLAPTSVDVNGNLASAPTRVSQA